MKMLKNFYFKLLTGMFLITGSLNLAFATENNDFKSIKSEKIAALKEITSDIKNIDRQIETIAWLQEMSKNIEKRVPDHEYRFRLLRTVLDESLSVGVDPQLALAVIEVESNFNRKAVSKVGAQGLMQVMPFWKNELGHETDDLYDLETNVRYGCAILKHYIDRFSPSVSRALAAYNGSLGKQKYPNKVFARLKKHWEFETYFNLKESEIIAIKDN